MRKSQWRCEHFYYRELPLRKFVPEIGLINAYSYERVHARMGLYEGSLYMDYLRGGGAYHPFHANGPIWVIKNCKKKENCHFRSLGG